MKKIVLPCILLLICFSFVQPTYANTPITEIDIAIDDDSGASIISYIIVDDNGRYLAERGSVEIGDSIIIGYNEYEIYMLDYVNKIAYSKYIKTIERPQPNTTNQLRLTKDSKNFKIGLYMSHNDESYVIGDGTSSIYGAGGIHDVASLLKTELIDRGYSVDLREDLHLPHDSSAYNRSKKTASGLIQSGAKAIFDIHRDGVARSVYVKNIDGVYRCKVRIVIGKGNTNYENNLAFAMQIVSVAEELCPWLILDVYSGKGTYNQNLTSNALLFEMGTYLAEKELVLQSVDELAAVIDKTLTSRFSLADQTLMQNSDIDGAVDQNEDNLGDGLAPSETQTPSAVDGQDLPQEAKESKNVVNIIFAISIVATLGVAVWIGIKKIRF